MRNPMRRDLSSSRGFTLVELVIVIAVMGLMLAMAMPRIRDALVSRDLKSARAAIANMYARARINALQTRKSSTINFSTTDVWVTMPVAGGEDTVGTVAQLSSAYGVTVDASTASITVLPTGLSNMAATATIKVTRAGKSDSVVISGYGRLK